MCCRQDNFHIRIFVDMHGHTCMCVRACLRVSFKGSVVDVLWRWGQALRSSEEKGSAFQTQIIHTQILEEAHKERIEPVCEMQPPGQRQIRKAIIQWRD